jgi:hypothetical protein
MINRPSQGIFPYNTYVQVVSIWKEIQSLIAQSFLAIEHHMGDMGNAGDDNVEDQEYSFDVSALGVGNYDVGSFGSFCTLGPEGQRLDPSWSFEHVSDSAFSASFYCEGLAV